MLIAKICSKIPKIKLFFVRWMNIWNIQNSKICLIILATEITKWPWIMIARVEILLLFPFTEGTMVNVTLIMCDAEEKCKSMFWSKKYRKKNILFRFGIFGILKTFRLYLVGTIFNRELMFPLISNGQLSSGHCWWMSQRNCFTGFLSTKCDDDYSGRGFLFCQWPRTPIQNCPVIIKLKQITMALMVIWMPSNYLVTPMRSANNFVVKTQCAKVELFHYIHGRVFLTDRLVSSRDSKILDNFDAGYVWYGWVATESTCSLKQSMVNCHPVHAGECGGILERSCLTGWKL